MILLSSRGPWGVPSPPIYSTKPKELSACPIVFRARIQPCTSKLLSRGFHSPKSFIDLEILFNKGLLGVSFDCRV